MVLVQKTFLGSFFLGRFLHLLNGFKIYLERYAESLVQNQQKWRKKQKCEALETSRTLTWVY